MRARKREEKLEDSNPPSIAVTCLSLPTWVVLYRTVPARGAVV